MATFISNLGDTRVLTRDVEQQLAAVVQKSARLEAALAAQQAQLGRPPTHAELAQAHVRRLPERMHVCMHAPPGSREWVLPCTARWDNQLCGTS